jgi:putative ABC transport system ATP-binding protein
MTSTEGADRAASGAPGAAARAVGATKIYGRGETEVKALDQVDAEFDRGRFHAIMGPSGSGKSTLMHCLAGLDRLTAGQVFIGDVELGGLDDSGLTKLRRDRVGFIFQSFNLVPTLNALENITLPMDLAGRKPDREWLDWVIAILGIGDRLRHKPLEMSGGQQQRVAVGRALASKPDIIFGDEPTGNLDSRASADVMRLLRDAVDATGQSVVIVTHDPAAAGFSDRVVLLEDGRIVGELLEPSAQKIIDHMKVEG